MTNDEYKQGIGIMSATGILRSLEPETVLVWRELLIDLDYSHFRQAVIHICKTKTDFYPGTNIPALIRESAKDFKKKEHAEVDNFQDKFEQYKLEAAGPTDLAEIIGKAGFEMKSMPGVSS
mgnify:FL=1